MRFSPWHIFLEHTTYYYSLSWSFLNALDFLSHSSLIVNWLGLTCTFLSFQFLTVFCFLFWIPDLPETIHSPNVELVFFSLLWTGFLIVVLCSVGFSVEVWLDKPIGCDSSREDNNNSVFRVTVNVEFCDNNNDVLDPDSVLDGNDNNNGTFAWISTILSMIFCSPNCDVTPDFLSLVLPFASRWLWSSIWRWLSTFDLGFNSVVNKLELKS